MSIDLLLLIIAVLAAMAAGGLAGRDKKTGIAYAMFGMLVAALLAARAVHVALWFDIYRLAPRSMLDVRDGGFNAWAGIAAAALLAIWLGRRRTLLRKPLAVALVSGILVWGGMSSAILLMEMGNASLPKSPLTTLKGEPADLAKLAAGKPIVLNLWATWCPPCRRELPTLAAAQKRETWASFVFADQGENAMTVQRYLAAEGLDLNNVLLDAGAKIGPEVGAGGLPMTLFYGADGRLVDTHLGQLTPNSLAQKLNRLRSASQR